ncbi:MAG: ComEC/Rec2 family competence protein [Muribaculaceae bacterium]|nr:ComEC/Rec2 family competence protein [Muribaculaceae bacterium]
MGKSSILSRLPVLRLLIPLVIGVLLYRFFSHFWLPITLVVAAIVVALAFVFLKKSPSAALKLRCFHIIPLSFFMITVGWFAAYIAVPPELNLKDVNGNAVLARVEAIDFHEKSMEMQVKLLNLGDSNLSQNANLAKDKSQLNGSHIILSTKGCDYELEPGDLIAFTLNLSPVKNLGNPDEMDYASYLQHKGIRYRQHTKLESVVKVGSSPTLITRAVKLRNKLEHKILNSSLAPETQSMLIAVLLGNDDFISRETREHFSVVGVAHVLALSGLHIAIITMLIWFLLFPLDYLRAKKLRLVLTLLLLIGYDILTGMSPSVVRATVMIAFVFMSMLFYRKSTPLNSVAAAALVILVFSPSSLYSVGFQLSFITVTALIIFYQNFDIKYPSNRLLKYLYSLFLTSLVAMLSSLILTAYYFNTISVMSVLANIIILPIFPVFMTVGAVVLLLLTMGGSVGWLNGSLDWMTKFFNGSVNWFSTCGFGHSDVYVTWVAVVVYYAILMMVVMWLYRRDIKWLLAAGVLLIIGLAHSLVVDATTPKQGMVIFNSYNSTPVLYYNHGKALLWVPDVENDFDIDAFRRYHKAFFAHYRIDSVDVVNHQKEKSIECGIVKHPFAQLSGKSIVAVGKGHWKNYEPSDSSEVKFDILLVTKQFHSTITKATELYDVKTIILSGDIYDDNIPALEKDCQELGVPYYSIKSSGAYVIKE